MTNFAIQFIKDKYPNTWAILDSPTYLQ
jgi:hypothetical protein